MTALKKRNAIEIVNKVVPKQQSKYKKKKASENEAFMLHKGHLFPFRIMRLYKMHKELSSFQIKKIHCVGGILHRRFHQRWNFPHVVSTLYNLLNEIPKTNKLFLFLSTESLDPNHSSVRRAGDENVPILNVISSWVIPTTLSAQFDLQTQREEIEDMSVHGLSWVPCGEGGRIFVLECKKTLEWKVLEYMQLYLKRSKDALNEKNDQKVQSVLISYKGKDIVWDPELESLQDCVDDVIEDEGFDPADKDYIINLLLNQKRMEKRSAQKKIEKKIQLFDDMVDKLAEEKKKKKDFVLDSLDDMKFYKIYPSNKELEPVVHDFFGVTGFRKNTTVNRYIGNAEAFY